MFSQRENTHWFKQAPRKELSGARHCIPHPCAGLHILTHKEIFHVSKRQWPQNEKGIWGAHTFEFPGCIFSPGWTSLYSVHQGSDPHKAIWSLQRFICEKHEAWKKLPVSKRLVCRIVSGLRGSPPGQFLVWDADLSNSELAEADRRTEDVGAGCSSPLFHYPMKTERNESLRRGTWRVKGKPDLSELLRPG